MLLTALLSVVGFLLLFDQSLADISRLDALVLGSLRLDDRTCIAHQFLRHNHTRRLYSDAFVVGSTYDFTHTVEHFKWVTSMLNCVASFEAGLETSNSSVDHKGQYCYGYVGDQVVGMCLKNTCNYGNASLLVKAMLSTTPMPGVNNSKTSVPTVDRSFTDAVCIKTKWDAPWYRKILPVSAVLAEGLLVLVAVGSAIYQLIFVDRRNDRFLSKLILCFSLKTSLKQLVAVPNNPEATIRCLFGLRILGLIWTTAGHSFGTATVFFGNAEEFRSSLRDPLVSQLVTNFTLCTDVFFLLGGTLSAYGWFRKIQKLSKTKSQDQQLNLSYWLSFYRHRIVRLWPTYAFVVFTQTCRYSISGEHRFWPPIDAHEQCPKYWWQNLLFLNSLYPNRCMPWCWYFGTDFIFYLLSPLFLMAIYYQPKLGVSFTMLVIALSSILRALIAFGYNFPPVQFFWFAPPQHYNQDMFSHHVLLYVKPYTRIGSYLIGILLGYLLTADCKHLQAVFTKRNTISALVQFVGWLLSTIGVCSTVFGAYPAIQNWGDGVSVGWRVYDLVYVAIHRVIFSISVGWLIFMCHLGGVATAPLNWLLGHRMLVLWANLSYAAYLVHVTPVLSSYIFAGQYPLQWHGFLHQFFVFILGQVIASYLCGLFLSAMIELPVRNLERLLLKVATVDRRSAQKHSQAVSTAL